MTRYSYIDSASHLYSACCQNVVASESKIDERLVSEQEEKIEMVNKADADASFRICPFSERSKHGLPNSEILFSEFRMKQERETDLQRQGRHSPQFRSTVSHSHFL